MNIEKITKHLLASCKFEKELKQITRPFFNTTPVKYFSYNRYFRNQTWLGLYTNIEPVEKALQANNGPLFVNSAGVAIEPGCYFHDDLRQLLKTNIKFHNIEKFFTQENNEIGHKVVQNGLLIIRNGELYDESYYFSMLDNSICSRSYYEKFINIFKKFNFIFLYQARKIITWAEKNKIQFDLPPIDLPPKENKLFDAVFFRDPNLSSKFELEPQKFGLDTPFGEVFLSRQEFFCLRYIALGHTYKQISDILQIKFKTVESYITNLKNKLNTHTKQDLVKYYMKIRVMDFEF